MSFLYINDLPRASFDLLLCTEKMTSIHPSSDPRVIVFESTELLYEHEDFIDKLEWFAVFTKYKLKTIYLRSLSYIDFTDDKKRVTNKLRLMLNIPASYCARLLVKYRTRIPLELTRLILEYL